MTDFCGIPLVSLRENSIAELDLDDKGVGVPGAIVLSKLLPSAAALTLLRCVATPGSPRMSAPSEQLHFSCTCLFLHAFPRLQGNTTLTSLKCATHLELAFSSYQRCDLCHHSQSYLMKERLGLVVC